MSSNTKIVKINRLFENFLNHIHEVREDVGSQSEYTKGYLACVADMIGSSEDSYRKREEAGEALSVIDIISKQIDMQSRAEVIDEVVGGLGDLIKAYKSVEAASTEGE